MTITTTAPDPDDDQARALAAGIRRRQALIRVVGRIGHSAGRTSRAENEWLIAYGVAEAAKRRIERRAARDAWRAKR